ncbi:MAG: DUF2779 domain-containing protein [Pseudomonadota bacterium]
MARYLTKSRFKLAVECPTKLYYTGKSTEYANTQIEDDFLQSLAEGGFQVGELAKLMYPGGLEISSSGHEAQIVDTSLLLRKENVILFEAAISYGSLFVRVDILKKQGNHIELIEVKAKSFDPRDEHSFRGLRGTISGEMLPYLQDVAFQKYVIEHAFPEFHVNSFLMLADKSKVSTVDGLNQLFKISRLNGRPSVRIARDTNSRTIGLPLLTAVNVDSYLEEILSLPIQAPGAEGYFPGLVDQWSAAYATDQRITPPVGGQCGNCEFRRTEQQSHLKSGVHECWKIIKDIDEQVFYAGVVLDIWNFRGKQRLIEDGVLSLSDVEKEHLGWQDGDEDFDGGLNNRQRQWMQVSKKIPGNLPYFLNKKLIAQELSTWQYPYHFIDFETSRVAIPFFSGQYPYSNIAFQFSHHVMNADGSLVHQSQFLSTIPGVKPNYDFVRELKRALGNIGSVFMWSPHENTTLNAILEELNSDKEPPSDSDDLRKFILSLTRKKQGNKIVHKGERAMIDLCELSKRVYFHPMTKGSNSIKKVLPAVMNSSNFIKDRYSKPIYGAHDGIPSLNFVNQIWWHEVGGKVLDPYKLLPPVFSDISTEIIDGFDSDEEFQINQGGAATTAYARLQFENISKEERTYINNALLRYCELDTLAMAMVLEGWTC